MLVPPTSTGLLSSASPPILFNFHPSLMSTDLDTTKLKARQFSRGTASASTSKNDASLWTETPAERQQRLADEVSGKKRRVTDAPVDENEDAKAKKRRRKAEEELIRRGVEEHTVCFYHIACQINYIDFPSQRKQRGAALVDQHATVAKKPETNEVPGVWDHSRDMGLGGRLMDDEKRSKMLKEAKGLGDRFGSGKSGGFL